MDTVTFINSVRHETQQGITVFRLVLDTAAPEIAAMAERYGFDKDKLFQTFILYLQADGIHGIASAMEQGNKPDAGDEWKNDTEEY